MEGGIFPGGSSSEGRKGGGSSSVEFVRPFGVSDTLKWLIVSSSAVVGAAQRLVQAESRCRWRADVRQMLEPVAIKVYIYFYI